MNFTPPSARIESRSSDCGIIALVPAPGVTSVEPRHAKTENTLTPAALMLHRAEIASRLPAVSLVRVDDSNLVSHDNERNRRMTANKHIVLLTLAALTLPLAGSTKNPITRPYRVHGTSGGQSLWRVPGAVYQCEVVDPGSVTRGAATVLACGFNTVWMSEPEFLEITTDRIVFMVDYIGEGAVTY